MDYIDENFDAEAAVNAIIEWIRRWFDVNGANCKAVIGISGGKDSSTVAALCVRALGKERVLGVLMPRGEQPDIWASEMLVKALGIEHVTINIAKIADAAESNLAKTGLQTSRQALINMPARVRMTVLYMVSQSIGGRVANTCNLSEDYVGYSTRWGDSVGDFCPISHFTVGEVKAMARVLGLPEKLVEKDPSDGLCGKTDEDNLGFTYADLDRYIRTGTSGNAVLDEIIAYKHSHSLFKLDMPPSFQYNA